MIVGVVFSLPLVSFRHCEQQHLVADLSQEKIWMTDRLHTYSVSVYSKNKIPHMGYDSTSYASFALSVGA